MFQARRLYGIAYLVGQFILSIASLLTLICCSLEVSSWAYRVLLLVANFGYLFNISAQTLSAISSFLYTLPTPSSNICKKTWTNALALLCILGFPLSMTLQQAFSGPPKRTTHPESGILTHRHGVLYDRACSFIPTSATLYYLLMPATCLLLIQLLVICIALRRQNTLEKGLKVHQRLMVALKTCMAQTLVWGMALAALISGQASLWHIFTLCLALQSIFTTMVCILSRSVIGAALAVRGNSKSNATAESAGHDGCNELTGGVRAVQICRYKLNTDDDRYYY